MREDIFIELISNDSSKWILEFAGEKELETKSKEGSLVDNYLIYNKDSIKFEKIKETRKFIVLKEVYVDHYKSLHSLLLTDKEPEGFEEDEECQNSCTD